MAGTDISGYSYPNFIQDYTYYGNGCPNDWGDGGDGGSQQSCTTRIAPTADHEDMKNGTYYNRNGATAGSTLTTAGNTDAPDSFCPLGWQMPYGGTGGDYYDKSKSWTVLLNTYNYVSGQQSAREIGKYPLSYVRSGDYDWNVGRVYEMNRNHLSWSSTNKKSTDAYIFNYYGSGYNRTEATYKIAGRTVRCGQYFWHPENEPI